MLNEQQQQAVDCADARIICLAAPGAGKTRVLTERVARLLRQGVHGSEILCVTFTRKAAREMLERLEALQIPDQAIWSLTVRTFHGWAALCSRNWHDVLGMRRDFTIRDATDADDLLKFVALELGEHQAEGRALNHWLTSPLATRTRKRLQRNAQVMSRYRRLLRKSNAIDYDGLEHELGRLVKTPMAVEQMRGRWQHVLVDEGQDTSSGQQEILEGLEPEHLFMVADISQAIYSFRGAHPDGIVTIKEHPDWTVLTLPTNYRSVPGIVEAATRLGEAMGVPGLDQRAHRAALDEEPITTIESWEWPDRAAQVAEQILAYRAPDDEPRPWASMAVLSPTWATLTAISRDLEALDIPHRIARPVPELWESHEVRWAISCLRVAHNPREQLALWRALTAFECRVSVYEWARIQTACAASRSRPWDWIREAPREDFQRCQRLIAGMDAAVDALQEEGPLGRLKLLDAVLRIVRCVGAELQDMHMTTRAANLARWETELELWTLQHPGCDVETLLDWYAGRQVDGVEDQEEPEDEVTLITIHGAKGLEWGAVWLLGLGEGAFPRARSAGPGLEEERRKAYVAITRARDRLVLVHGHPPSRFIGEMGVQAREG